jgi:4-alpha-glucanotransferase
VLADRMGIIDEYVDQTGKEIRRTSDATRIALLGVLGFDAQSASQARRSLERLDADEAQHIIPPVAVVREGDNETDLLVRFGDTPCPVSWSITMRDERGNEFTGNGRAWEDDTPTVRVAYPAHPPAGYYQVDLRMTTDAGTREGRQLLVVTPDRAPAPHIITGGRNVFGLTVNLYTVHSQQSWGIGNLGDLRLLVEWAAGQGAAFVGLNPLHALFNRGENISPYSPVSRLFRNPLYLDIAAIPELADSRAARDLVGSSDLGKTLAELRASDKVEYERIAEIMEPVLRALHTTFVEHHASGRTDRGRAYAAYVTEQGEALERFATFMALDRHFVRSTRGKRTNVPWRRWPKGYRRPESPDVLAFRSDNEREIDFHRYLQFELDTQLAAAAAAARQSGMAIGLYQDLAIGSSPDGSDAWAFPGLFLDGASIGAPPDQYSAAGQTWGLPPIDPRKLRYDGYRYWIQLVRAALRHGGALRIDHVLGLFRQFWIPDGETGEKGAYVRFPTDELLGILALEATRAGAIVVGEDLGTVPPDVPPALANRQILSSKVMYFERTPSGGFKAPSTYPHLALATATTHDMATITGWWNGSDIDLRNRVGLLGPKGDRRATEISEAHLERVREKKALLKRLAADGALASAAEPESPAALRAAIHRLLCKSPSALVGISLDDVVGEEDPVNLPGVGPADFASWTRRLRVSIDELRSDESFTAALGCEGRGSR